MKIIFVIIFALITILFIYGLFYLAPKEKNHQWFVSKENVRGSSIQHKGYTYTLNFEQQNLFIDLINDSKKQNSAIKAMPEPNSKNDIEQITLYLFDDSEITLIPKENTEIRTLIVFQKDRYFSVQINNPDHFNDFIHKTYD